MIKIIFILIFNLFLFADEIKVFGESAITKNDTIVIKDGILLKNEMIISANKIIYNKKENNVIAMGNVYINYDKNDFILSNLVKVDLKTSSISAKPFFIFNFINSSWLNSIEIKNKNEFYYGKKSIASTCDVNNPDWKIIATSVDYNKNTKWIDLYNPRLYIKNVPILYLPYLGFSMDKKRSSGFLKPLMGYSANEGFLFTLPYYQTLGASADLEIDPTIRKSRGRGIYSTFRFVHSETSQGEFKIGYFKDKVTYQTEYNLANQIHRGWSFLYNNYNLFDKSDKLYIDLKNANDTDYFYLDAYNYNFQPVNTKILTSKINYYVKNNNDYLGVYGSYFKDTSKISNDDTMQILPQINYHKFNKLFWNNFSYSVDANIYNYTRKTGFNAIKKSILIPLNYNINFFDDYLKLGLTEQLSISQVDTSDDKHSKLTRLDTFINLYSNLSKEYSDFIHHISTSITFGMDNYYNYNDVESDYIDTSLMKKSISFKLFQYLIAENWQVEHKISEVYYIDDKDTKSRYSDLLNDISLNYYDYYLKENNKYSINSQKINYNSITIGFDDNIKQLEGTYIYQREMENIESSKSYTLSSYWKFDGLHKIFAKYNYDLILNKQNYYFVGISMKKKCWNYSLSYKRELLPLLTNDGISNITQKTIYFEIELVPLGGIKQQYQFKSNKG